MKKISNLLNNENIINHLNQENQEDSILSNEAIDLVDALFIIFQSHVIYFRAGQVINQQQLIATKREWVKTFQARKITKKEITRGVERIRKIREPLKNITPAEFIKFCNPSAEDLGLPDVNQAYLEAIKNYRPGSSNITWSHEVVRHAAVQTTSYELMNRSRDVSFDLFSRNYEISCRMLVEGDLRPIPKALESEDYIEKGKQESLILDRFKGARGIGDLKAALRG